MIEREVEMMIDNVKSRVQTELGMDYEQYLTQLKKTAEDVKKEFEKIAEDKVKGYLVLHQLEKDEKIEVSDKEIEEKIEEIINQYPNKEEARKGIDMEHAKMHIEDELKTDKIFALFGC